MRAPMSPLPAAFADALMPPDGKRLPKRERTQRQLIVAATKVFSSHGVGNATMQQIAGEAGMTTGTVYNHFRTKSEIVTAVARTIAAAVRQRSAPARSTLKTGAEQMAAGCFRYLGLAQASPTWALLVLDVASVDPVFRKILSGFVRTELRRGLRNREFSVINEAAGLDIVIGATMEAMRRIASGKGGHKDSVAVVASILRGLGVPWERAQRIALTPLPLFDK